VRGFERRPIAGCCRRMRQIGSVCPAHSGSGGLRSCAGFFPSGLRPNQWRSLGRNADAPKPLDVPRLGTLTHQINNPSSPEKKKKKNSKNRAPISQRGPHFLFPFSSLSSVPPSRFSLPFPPGFFFCGWGARTVPVVNQGRGLQFGSSELEPIWYVPTVALGPAGRARARAL